MRLFDNALMTVSPYALVGIWADLVEAEYGKAGYGGDTAEIYAYRLMPYSPMAHTKDNRKLAHKIAVQAANALCAIVEEFCTQRDVEAEIDGFSVDKWCRAHNYGGGYVFDHRCYVRISKRTKNTHGSK